MDKEKIKTEIEGITSKIVELSTDKDLTEKLISDVISLKGQYDIEPMRIHVREKDVIKEYNMDNIRIIRCRNCIIWQFKGGYEVIVKSRMTSLYEFMDGLLDLKDKYETLDESMRKVYDASFFGISTYLLLPLYGVTDDKFFHDTAIYLSDNLEKLFNKLLNGPLKDEETKENDAFENERDAFDVIQEKPAHA